MTTKYQLIFIGHNNSLQESIIDTFKNRISDLGINVNAISILNSKNFKDIYIGNAPTVAVYFGGDNTEFPHLEILDKLFWDANLIIPVVNNLKDFNSLVPKQLQPINGFELNSKHNIEALVGRIMEGLGLLRLARRLFISYRRAESTGVAIQLYERLEQAGFDVFLDTHSIRPGEVFQDELWHRLVDTDVVVLLNTKGFLESEWTQKELAQASAKSIGILQLIWPNHAPEASSGLTIQLPLLESNFQNSEFNGPKSYLEENIIANIINEVESLRARSLGARQDNIITEFMKSAAIFSIKANLQSEKFITVDIDKDNQYIIIPTIGVPHALTYNQSADLIRTIKEHDTKKIFLLFDHINIRDKWLKHLTWLDNYLPVRSLKLLEIDNWFENCKI